MVVAREIDGSARFRATQHAPRIGTMGGEDVPISPPHIRLETLISPDKGPLDKSWPFYGVFIPSTHAAALLAISNLDPSQPPPPAALWWEQGIQLIHSERGIDTGLQKEHLDARQGSHS
jgi:hypothetical protein